MSDFIGDGQCVTHFHACDCREEHFADLEAENAKLKARDIILCYNDGCSSPFERAELTIIDVGVNDNCVTVKSAMVDAMMIENARLKQALQDIYDMAIDNAQFDELLFDARDWKAICDEGGAVADWTTIAIYADDALKNKE